MTCHKIRQMDQRTEAHQTRRYSRVSSKVDHLMNLMYVLAICTVMRIAKHNRMNYIKNKIEHYATQHGGQ